MPSYCVVPFCHNDVGGFHFPKDKDLKARWEHAVRRKDWKPKTHSVVCRRHFRAEDLITTTIEGYLFQFLVNGMALSLCPIYLSRIEI